MIRQSLFIGPAKVLINASNAKDTQLVFLIKGREAYASVYISLGNHINTRDGFSSENNLYNSSDFNTESHFSWF